MYRRTTALAVVLALVLVAVGAGVVLGAPSFEAALLFAVGAVSGTVLSFELGLLWPDFMDFAGGIVGMYFAMPYVAPDRVESTRPDAPPAGNGADTSGRTCPHCGTPNENVGTIKYCPW